jgi:hypothetical protein
VRVGVWLGNGVIVGVNVGNRVGSGLAVGVGSGVVVGWTVAGTSVFTSIWGGSPATLKPKQEDVTSERTNKMSRYGGIRLLFVIIGTGKNSQAWQVYLTIRLISDGWIYPMEGYYK